MDTTNCTSKKRHPLYLTWAGIRQRCCNSSCPAYRHYGARGITVCDRWKDDFWAFVADMGPQPTGDRYTIGRIDNDGPYSPENCRWETCAQQMRNTRRSRRITVGGRTMCAKDWSTELGIDPSSLRSRAIARGGDWVAAVADAPLLLDQSESAQAIMETLVRYGGGWMDVQQIGGYLRDKGIHASEGTIRGHLAQLSGNGAIAYRRGAGPEPALYRACLHLAISSH
jgi:hypothetical protein